MTEAAFLKLKAGDKIVNKRGSGPLTVTEVGKPHLGQRVLRVKNEGGEEFEIPQFRYKEFTLMLEQTRMEGL